MESNPAFVNAQGELKAIRETLLSLHKALLDSERTSYELVHGKIGSSSEFLQLLISDHRFAWLRPVTTLIVQIDEALAAKNPPREGREFEQLIQDTRALLSPSRETGEFWGRYFAAVQRDPGVAVLHDQMERQLAVVNKIAPNG